ncbi:hypothetical protein FH972_023778 [Carpinus fangiana]|uniref:Cytochrome P450 n=1 Tax=Carpinus fangiana TaxID=176857 RepID=A0A5N6KW71_9ROSI|nr:hypothetical protein FH972_023778 [Carpinus fangiana]
MALLTLLLLSFSTSVIVAIWRATRWTSDGPAIESTPLPGPRGLPFVGSIFALSPVNPWLTFHKWSQEYGPLYQVELAGTSHVWIADEEIAFDLLSKKAKIYSDRPHIPALMDDNRTSGQYLPLLSNNSQWQRQRKFAKTIMAASQKAAFFGYPELESIRLMKELLDQPSSYNTAFESFVSRVTCRLAWGTSVAADELKQRARELLIGVSPTGSLLNKIPFLMLLPDCLSPAKAWERRRARTERAFFLQMQDEVRANLAPSSNSPSPTSSTTTADRPETRQPPSWTAMFLSPTQNPPHGIPTATEGAYAVGMHGIAGALTIAAPMQSFCLALCLHPQHLAPLHAEVDAVCPAAPPTLADLPRMPHLRACIRETLRWRPPVPTGIPHRSTAAAVYRGARIPAGAVLHPLEWSIARDPRRYPHPDVFDPRRWLDPASPAFRAPLSVHPAITGHSQFGWGHRVCQGQGVAEADLFVGLGALVWGFDVQRAVDAATGAPVPVPSMDFAALLIAKPRWFAFELRCRSEARRAWIDAAFREGREAGRYEPEREYWDSKNGVLGWGKPNEGNVTIRTLGPWENSSLFAIHCPVYVQHHSLLIVSACIPIGEHTDTVLSHALSNSESQNLLPSQVKIRVISAMPRMTKAVASQPTLHPMTVL